MGKAVVGLVRPVVRLGVVGATGEVAYAGVWMGGCSRETAGGV